MEIREVCSQFLPLASQIRDTTIQELHSNNMQLLIRDSNNIPKHSPVIKNKCQVKLSCTILCHCKALFDGIQTAEIQRYFFAMSDK